MGRIEKRGILDKRLILSPSLSSIGLSRGRKLEEADLFQLESTEFTARSASSEPAEAVHGVLSQSSVRSRFQDSSSAPAKWSSRRARTDPAAGGSRCSRWPG